MLTEQDHPRTNTTLPSVDTHSKLYFLQLYCASGISPMGYSDCFPPGKPAATEPATQPTMHAGCFGVSIIHRTLDMDYRIFNVRTNVNACDFTHGGVRTHVRESALKVDFGRGTSFRSGESNVFQRRNGPMLHQWATSPSPFLVLKTIPMSDLQTQSLHRHTTWTPITSQKGHT